MMFLLALPAWIKVAVAGLAVVGALQLQHWWVVRGLRQDIVKLSQLLDQEKLQTYKLSDGLQIQRESIDDLEARISKSNADLDALNLKARQVETAANLRVARAVRAGEEQARELRAETTRVPPGHLEMNTWIQERLGS